MIVVRFTIPVPASSKNSRRVFRHGGRIILAKSAAAVTSQRQVRDAAASALVALGITLPPGSTLFGDDDLDVTIEHLVEQDACVVTVQSAGPRPKGRTGRKRDLQNLQEAVLDALQGELFDNDNAVVRLTMKRTLSVTDNR